MYYEFQRRSSIIIMPIWRINSCRSVEVYRRPIFHDDLCNSDYTTSFSSLSTICSHVHTFIFNYTAISITLTIDSIYHPHISITDNTDSHLQKIPPEGGVIVLLCS